MRKNSCLLPRAKRKDSHITRSRQTVFGGLSSCPVPSNEEIRRMQNISASTYPAMGTLEKRFAFDVSSASGKPHGICHHDGIVVAQGERLYRLSDEGALSEIAKVSDTDKRFASFGSKLFVLPDEICYDSTDGSLRSLSAATDLLTEAALGSNYVTFGNANWQQMGFEVGDGVEISVKDYFIGETSVFHRKIIGMTVGTLFFDTGFERTGTFDLTVSRSFPSMDGFCALGDRLMGYRQNTVYLSEAGNPFNWSSVRDSDEDPVAMETGGSGEITACIAYRGYGVLFKEDHLFRLMGHRAGDYLLESMAAPGVVSQSADSLCEAAGWLYYLAPGGVYRYDGDHPEAVGSALPHDMVRGVGGTDGQCYYLAAFDVSGGGTLYAYHCNRGMWYVQDLSDVKSMATQGDKIFIQTTSGRLLRNAKRDESLPKNLPHISETASALPSMVEFGENFGGTSQGLRLHGIHLRAQSEENAGLWAYVAYDGSDTWESIGTAMGKVNGRLHFPVYPRRCASYRLRLIMMGQWLISEIISDCEKGKQ